MAEEGGGGGGLAKFSAASQLAAQLMQRNWAKTQARAALMRVPRPAPRPVGRPAPPPPPPMRRSDDLRENAPHLRPKPQIPILDLLSPSNPITPSGPPSLNDKRSDDRRENRPEFNRVSGVRTEIPVLGLLEPAPPPPKDPLDEERKLRLADYKENAPHLTGKPAKSKQVTDLTIRQMIDDVRHDPMATPERIAEAESMANSFRERSRYRHFTEDEFIDNPLVRTLNDVSTWSRFRIKVSEWNNNKKKTGQSATGEDAGDGTFTGLIDNGSFSSVTSPSALSPYLVIRDENGLLAVVTADQWIQGKYTQMHKDPVLAANMITALALTSMYGSDSTANSQASRVVVDKNGNPVKGLPSGEDLSALKRFANEAAIFQNQGEEVAIDDVLAELVDLGRQVSDQNKANGEHGSGGGGRRGYGGGGYGGGGYGGGGGGQPIRLTDPEQLKALADSIGRQRMGRSLTAEEHAAFVAYFHQIEAQASAAYYAGQTFTQVDPEAQAIAWIQNHFQKESAANQYGDLAIRFMQMMQGQQLFGGMSS